MAIAPRGTKQKTYYVREDLAKVVAHMASDGDKRESDIVNEAFDYYINIKLNEEQRRVFGYKKEQTNADDSGRDSVATGTALQGAGRGDGDEGGSGGTPPGTPKRAGKKPRT